METGCKSWSLTTLLVWGFGGPAGMPTHGLVHIKSLLEYECLPLWLPQLDIGLQAG